jgi:hypothetical protein
MRHGVIFVKYQKFIYEHMYTVSRDVEGHFFRTVAQSVSPLLSFNKTSERKQPHDELYY